MIGKLAKHITPLINRGFFLFVKTTETVCLISLPVTWLLFLSINPDLAFSQHCSTEV